MIPLQNIIEAKKRIRGVVNKTQFAYAPALSQISGAEVYIKKENLQLTGAFKIRGAYNKIATLSENERGMGVIAASAGNHAQGVAYSAREFDVKAVIVMPEATPLLKVMGTKSLGAEVILHGDNFDEAFAFAIDYAKEHNLTFIHPFEDSEVMAGQGTIALEMIDDISSLDIVVVPIGGGGLISGVASAIKQIDPKIRVIGVGAKGAPALHNSFNAKKAINSKSVRTIADGIAVRDVSSYALDTMIECVDEVVLVDDEEIASAILFLLERQKLVVEGAGAAGVAAIMHQKFPFFPKDKIGTILSGGNIDVQMLSVIIEKGLVKSARKMTLIITLVDKPGALMRLTDIFKETNANIVKIDYDRVSTTLEFGDANITITLETKGKDHQESIRRKLLEAQYNFEELL
ncbi:MAG: threonine ammonia-lyase [Campylobacteraceae bacterium]|jgi:threonine dehydratase|nr:threonine ammonia-lyase [Campylobacteraceae bacterium]